VVKTIEVPNPRFRDGDIVTVHDRGITPYRGQVRSVKWSPQTGWWCDVLRESDRVTWAVHEDKLRREVVG